MSERMNKEKAREELRDRKILAEIEYNQSEDAKKKDNLLRYIQALDIAIESLQNDDLIKRLENGECCKHSSNKVVAYNRDYLDENLEMEFDILKNTRDTVQAIRKGASDDEVAERLAKVVKPYERKE
jgi:hypothetical protein